jgi:phosphocarrier protein FPr
MIGIVIVSHSAKLAQGVAELASEMGGDDLKLCGVGGLDAPGQPFGTDPVLIMNAIEQVYSTEGVLVLMDLGSALLSTEMAVEMLPPEKAQNVLPCAAPLVEGTLAAAVQARLGASLEQAAAEARSALGAKFTQLGEPLSGLEVDSAAPFEPTGGDVSTLSIVVTNPLGLHARPAARFVQTAARFPEAKIRVKNQTINRGPVSARSINGVTTLGIRQGHEILITSRGRQAQVALDAFQELADNNFGDDATLTDRHTQTISPSTSALNVTPDSDMTQAEPLAGVSVSPGIAIGPVIQFRPEIPTVPDHFVEDPNADWNALIDSIEKTRVEIQNDFESATHRTDEYTAGIFEAHLLFLDDDALLSPTRARIFDQLMNAAAAWIQTIEQVAEQYRNLEDEYLQTRARDVENVGNRVLLNLLGTKASPPSFDEPGILIAPNLTTSEMVSLNPAKVLGILTAFGGPTSHAAILARSLGIPAIAGLGEQILGFENGALLVIDGGSGAIWRNPDPKRIARFKEKAQVAEETRRLALADSREPAITGDGHQVEVVANISIPAEAQYALDSGAEGVGVFRTEYLFLRRNEPPDEDEQVRAYRAAALGLGGYPLIIRTLDAGGDKMIPYLNLEQEPNPFLGQRGLRLSLEYPDLFKTQLRAILRVAAEFEVKILFPMVSTLDEWHAARTLLMEARRGVSESGKAVPDDIETGIMVEVPAAALLADLFAEEVDFFSIGTNDLTQYLLAAERGNPKVVQLSDGLHPASLRMIQRVVEAAHNRGKWAGVCGELAGDPQAIPILVGLGVDELSMNAPAIPRAKQIIRQLDFAIIRKQAQAALKLDSAVAVRATSGLTQIVSDGTDLE